MLAGILRVTHCAHGCPSLWNGGRGDAQNTPSTCGVFIRIFYFIFGLIFSHSPQLGYFPDGAFSPPPAHSLPTTQPLFRLLPRAPLLHPEGRCLSEVPSVGPASSAPTRHHGRPSWKLGRETI